MKNLFFGALLIVTSVAWAKAPTVKPSKETASPQQDYSQILLLASPIEMYQFTNAGNRSRPVEVKNLAHPPGGSVNRYVFTRELCQTSAIKSDCVVTATLSITVQEFNKKTTVSTNFELKTLPELGERPLLEALADAYAITKFRISENVKIAVALVKVDLTQSPRIEKYIARVSSGQIHEAYLITITQSVDSAGLEKIEITNEVVNPGEF